MSVLCYKIYAKKSIKHMLKYIRNISKIERHKGIDMPKLKYIQNLYKKRE
jgi:hypothetical protein